MPRPRIHSPQIDASIKELAAAVTGLATALATRATAAPVAMAPRTKGQRGPGKNNPKLKAALKKSWAAYSPKQRAARIAAITAGRKRALQNAGKAAAVKRVAPKPSAAARKGVVKRVPKTARPKASGGWASMTPAQRAERMAKMRAGRAASTSPATAAAAQGSGS